MYQVTLINGSKNTIINSTSLEKEAPKISGTIKQGINTIDSFTFNISINNEGFNKIRPLKSLVEVLNIKSNQVEFIGRILIASPSMDSNGLFVKNVICESELSYLYDSCTRYGKYQNISVRDYLKAILDNHNNQVEEHKRFEIGIVTVKDNNDSLYRYLGYEDSFKAIKDDLIDKLGGELRVRYENGVRYLDYLEEIGTTSNVEIRLAKNLKTIKQELDPSQVITRLVVLGTKLEDSNERLTIKSVNGGVDYLDDLEAIEEFGIIQKPILFDDVTIASNLKSKGESYLKQNNKIKKKHSIEALDLFTINLDPESFNVGNYYKVINQVMHIDENMRVIEKSIDINEPHNSKLTIGDKFDDIKDYQIKQKNNTKKLTNELDDTRSKVVNVNNDLDITNSNLNTTSNDLKKQKKYLIMGV